MLYIPDLVVDNHVRAFCFCGPGQQINLMPFGCQFQGGINFFFAIFPILSLINIAAIFSGKYRKIVLEKFLLITDHVHVRSLLEDIRPNTIILSPLNHALRQHPPAFFFQRIPPKVETLGENCFQGSAALEEIELPASLVKIESGVFRDCASLRKIIFRSETPPGFKAFTGGGSAIDLFTGTHAELVILVPPSCEAAYKTALSTYDPEIQNRVAAF